MSTVDGKAIAAAINTIQDDYFSHQRVEAILYDEQQAKGMVVTSQYRYGYDNAETLFKSYVFYISALQPYAILYRGYDYTLQNENLPLDHGGS